MVLVKKQTQRSMELNKNLEVNLDLYIQLISNKRNKNMQCGKDNASINAFGKKKKTGQLHKNQ